VEVFIGRQPILDRQQSIAGYELLFRSSQANFCDQADAVAATSQVIVTAVLGVGLDKLLAGKPAFINFDRTLLLGDWTTLLPADKSVIEILESVPPDQEVLSACRRLRDQGYALALDDCLDDQRTAAFAPFVDILKVDFQQLSILKQGQIIKRYRKFKLKMLAEKVETEFEFTRAMQLGYHYFQGYFFARPTIVQSQRIPPSQLSCLRLVKHVQRPDLDYTAIEQLIRQDISFSHALLKYLNSGIFQRSASVESVRQALILLGADEIRKWVWMASLANLGQSRPPLLIPQVLYRGRFCEFIAQSSNLCLGAADPFLLGMFSLLGAVMQRPLNEVLGDLNIAQNLRQALLGPVDLANPLSRLLHLVKSYETANWDEVETCLSGIGLTSGALSTGYLETLSWVEIVLREDSEETTASQTASHYQADFHRDLSVDEIPLEALRK
jgi:c-di-GMP-related signal transduction protein